VLARHGNEPVMAEQGLYLAASFHPELSGDSRIHRYFLERIS
jgi:pyridoxal 5'-phosphate synthase pdxT subunit